MSSSRKPNVEDPPEPQSSPRSPSEPPPESPQGSPPGSFGDSPAGSPTASDPHPPGPGREPGGATDLFLELTPDRVLAAVEAAGLATRPVCYPLNSFENRVYEVELEDRERIIAKFYRPGRWSAEQILEEHRFLQELNEAEIPVGTVRPFPDGDTLKTIDHIYYALFDRRGGRAPDELSDALAERLGMLAARLHNVGVRRSGEPRLELTADTFIRPNLEWLERHGTLPSHLEGRYLDAGHRVADLLDPLMEGVETHRLHGDLHLGNVLDRDGVLTLVDLDDMMIGPAVQDVWLALPGRDEHALRQRGVFLAGYQQFRDFDRSTLRLVEPLRALRLIHYATWLARRWHDPVFPATWPHFGTEEYWRGETEALEEQVVLIREESVSDAMAEGLGLGAVPGRGEELLSNEDYFWDWEGDEEEEEDEGGAGAGGGAPGTAGDGS